MTPEQINIECAKIDEFYIQHDDSNPNACYLTQEVGTWRSGWYDSDVECWAVEAPEYTTSYDAIIPLIQKQSIEIKEEMFNHLDVQDKHGCVLDFTPLELATALLKAKGVKV